MITIEEEWKNIPNYEGIYQVSNFGNIRMLGRIDAGGYHRKQKTLKPYQQRSGYLNIKLRDAHGNRSPHLVHRLVANAFIDNPNHYPQVNHIDENVKNNRVDNLEWCTVEYNLSYGHHRDHCAKTLKNNSTNNAKLRKFAENQRVPVKQINSDGIVINIWPSMSAASKLGFKVGRISDCCNGKQKEHHGYRWELAQEPVIGGKRVIDVDNEDALIPPEIAWPVLEYMQKLRPESKFELKEVMGGYGLDLIETVAEKTEVAK